VGNDETRYTDELGNTTVTINDAFGRLSQAIEGQDPLNYYSKATYLYDVADRLVEIQHTAPVAGVTQMQSRSFTYDGYGRLFSENTPEAGPVWYAYTANDQVWIRQDVRNIVTTYQYDKRKLLTQTSYSGGSAPPVNYTYDAYGARATMTDGEGQTTYSYNGYRQLQSETRTFTGLPGNSYTLGYSYNQADQVKAVNYSSSGGQTYNKNINYAYNNVGALAGVGTNLLGSDPNNTTNVLNTTSFRATGAINQLTYGNGLQLTMGYNANRQQPLSMKVGPNGTGTVVNYTYDYYTAGGQNNNRLRKVLDNLAPYGVVARMAADGG
jgi:YD repeat-containing protein